MAHAALWLNCGILYCLLSATLTSALGPDCQCVVFSSTFGKDFGRFHSPDFPLAYRGPTDCLLYNFIAEPHEIVELSFSEFHIPKTVPDCSSGAHVKLFPHLTGAELNERTSWERLACGGRAEAPRTLYSSGSSMALSLHSMNTGLPEGAGFRGTFRFVDKRLFRTDGQKLAGTECDHQFLSGDLSASSGRFHSPRYPATYPGRASCAYRFRARSTERIKIVFEEFSMQKGDLSCADSADVVRVHDGGSRNAPVIRALCNEGSEVEVLSTGRELVVLFVAKSDVPGSGFKASYQFQGLHEIDSNHILEHAAGIFNAALNNVHAGPSDCDAFFNSDNAKEGIFTSPGYPSSYPSKTHCKFHFQGRGKERVQIVFTNFNLHNADADVKECEDSDRIDVYVPIEGRMERTESLCTDRPPGPVMSNGARMLLEFNGDRDSNHVRGFKAVYRFTEDFGITGGRQLDEQPCAFSYDSSVRQSGIFTSPNFPGSYPRDTECRYYFRGAPGQRIRLHFTYFDVEGVLPCEAISASDYMEFSNYMAQDPAHRRHCGQVSEFTVDSEDNFFKVNFRSNDRLDGTGFEASYMFYSEDYEDQQQYEEINTWTPNAAQRTYHHIGVTIIVLVTSNIVKGAFL